MGTIILIIAAIVEIVFGIYCIKTKSNQKKVRNLIHISSLTIFVIFTLASVIQWSFRWKLFTLILIIWATISGVSLIRRKSDKKEYKTVRIVFRAIAMWLIVAVAVMPALIFPQYKPLETTGEFKVNRAIYTVTDSNRIETLNNKGEKRKVTFEFWYPKDTNGRYPLVVFSHGAFGVRSSNTSTFMELASNGYVVCSISHPYHSMYTIDTDNKLTMADKSFIQEVSDVNNDVYDNETEFQLEQKWLKVRTDDMNFVLDTILRNAKDSNSDKVYQLIDTDKIGLIGHSLGGAASAKLGRDRHDINAVINLDADLLGECLGVANGKAIINRDIYPVPILSMYTDTMKKLIDGVTDPEFINHQKMMSDTTHKAYVVYIAGTNHMSFTDLPLISPFAVRMIAGSTKKMSSEQKADKYYVTKTMNNIVLGFFNCYLKGKGSFHPVTTY